MLKQIFVLITISLVVCMPPPTGTKCSVQTGAPGKVYKTTDGTNERCFAAVTPENKTKMPVLFWFHGQGGNAGHCGGQGDENQKKWSTYAEENGFAFVCGEALQYDSGNQKGGIWGIPEIITDKTGNQCEESDSVDIPYVKNMISELAKSDLFDTSRMFFSGCSMGSAESFYQATCMKKLYGDSISAFATHSTGLKIKGDDLHFPPDEYNTSYAWGECPNCEYFPAMVEKTNNLKACIFDNTGDMTTSRPDFYKSSKQLESKWKEAGNKCESSYGSGGHCQIHSFADIITCLDDGTGRLINKTQKFL